MKIVKVTKNFFEDCKEKGTDSELLVSSTGRPCVLLINLKYKGEAHKFVVPFRSNISPSAPSSQFFSLPPNKNTKSKHSHGIHYIKMFPITDKYIQKYNIEQDCYWQLISKIIDERESEIVQACQDYLSEYEKGNKHSMTPNIDGILSWLYDNSKN